MLIMGAAESLWVTVVVVLEERVGVGVGVVGSTFDSRGVEETD